MTPVGVGGSEGGGPDLILFDLGGVLMDLAGLRRLAELSGEDDDAGLRTKWVASRWVRAFERGECDADAFGTGIVRDWGLELTAGEFVSDFARWPAGPFEGSVELTRALHGTIPMGCLSNTDAVHWRQHLDRGGVVEHFDRRFVSDELGMTKPDPATFDRAIRTVGTAPDRILFLGGSHEHVHAARRSGIRAKQTRGAGEVRNALLSLPPVDSPAGRALRPGSPSAR